jgi:RimJ/RimL family protein N-acetyltransferase
VSPRPSPAHRLVTDRLVVRCWQPQDAPLLKDALDSSLDHLRPWMPWAHDEPKPLDEKIELLRGFRAAFDQGEDFVYGVFDRDERRVLGGSGLHRRVGDLGLEIGYWIRADAAGNGYATEAAAALTRAGLAVEGIDRIEIHCDPRNHASAAVPRKLGFHHEATLARRLRDPDGTARDVMIWTLFADAFPASACAGYAVEQFDAAGAPRPTEESSAR